MKINTTFKPITPIAHLVLYFYEVKAQEICFRRPKASAVECLMGFISFARLQEKSFSRGILVCIVLLYHSALVLTCFGLEHFCRL